MDPMLRHHQRRNGQAPTIPYFFGALRSQLATNYVRLKALSRIGTEPVAHHILEILWSKADDASLREDGHHLTTVLEALLRKWPDAARTAIERLRPSRIASCPVPSLPMRLCISFHPPTFWN